MKRILLLGVAITALYAQTSPAQTEPYRPAINNLAALNSWTPVFDIRSDGITVVTGGTGYGKGDVITITDSCNTSAKFVVAVQPGGIVTPGTGSTVTTGHAICAVAPGSGVLQTTGGSGTGLTVTALYAPYAANLFSGTVTINQGNMIIGGEVYPAPGGTEGTYVGIRAGSGLGLSTAFTTIVGFNAGGNGSGKAQSNCQSCTIVGTDAARNIQAGNNGGLQLTNIDLFGAGAGQNLGFNNNVQPNGIAGFGKSALGNLAAVNTANDVAFGPLAGQGASNSNFVNVTSIGATTGGALSSANGITILGKGVGNITIASGSDDILIGSGNSTSTVDTPAAGTSHYININNIITGTGMDTPSSSTLNLIGGIITMANIAQSAAAQTGTMCWSASGVTYDATLGCLASSARFKSRIIPLHNTLLEIMQMRPVSFVYKNNPADKARQVGLLAEEVNAIDPRLIGYEPDGVTPRGVRYAEYTAMLTAAIQEQQHEIEDLRRDLKSFHSKFKH